MDTERLDILRRQLQNRWPIVGAWLRYRALRELSMDGSAAAIQVLAGEAWRGDSADVRRAALDALRGLARRGNPPAQEALCRYVVHHDSRALLDEVQSAGYLPREESLRAVLFFLTEQWNRYEALDFDHAMLRAVYESGSERLRKRIAAIARDAGRLEWVGIVSGGRQGRRLAAMTDAEWRAALNVLHENERWDEVWRLAQDAPPRWSAVMLRRLKAVGWAPDRDEIDTFQALIRLAERWQGGDFRPLMELRATLRGHTDEVRCLGFAPDDRILATGSGDRTVRLWNLENASLIQTLEAHRGAVNCLAISPNGHALASGSRDCTAVLWRMPECRENTKVKGHAQRVMCLAFSPDSRLLATGGADSGIQLWSVPHGNSVATLEGHGGSVVDLAVTPDGETLISISSDATVRLWSLPDGKAIKTLRGHRDGELDAVLSLAVRPDGQLFATGATDATINLWSLPHGGHLQCLEGHNGHVTSLAISPDGQILASGSADQTVRLWRLLDGRPLALWEAHSGAVTQLRFSPDGDILVSACGDGSGHDHSLRLWSVPERKWMKTLNGHNRYISCVAFRPHGLLLASGSGDGTVRLWTSELDRLSTQPVRQSTLQDLALAQNAIRQYRAADNESVAWQFIAALLRRRHRHDVEIGDAAPRVIEVGEFDIEIEG